MKTVIATIAFFALLGLSSGFSQNDAKATKSKKAKTETGKVTEASKTEGNKKFESKEAQRLHAEDKSNGKAFSGKGQEK